MTNDCLAWWHIILHTRGTWLHGDPRGFRTRGHRIHSSGDYKQRPPRGEHAGLLRFHVRRSREAVVLPGALLSVVGQALLRKIAKQGYRVMAACVGPTHVHALAELPGVYGEAEVVAERWKQATSHAVRERLPGRVWAAGGKPVAIVDAGHYERVYGYILEHAWEGAWVWSMGEG